MEKIDLVKAQEICNQAVSYLQKNSYTQALSYFEKAEPIFSEESNISWLNYLLHQKFICYSHLARKSEAIKTGERVIKNYREEKNKKAIISFLIIYSEFWQNENNLSQALHYIKMAEALSLINKEISYLSFIYLRLARIFKCYKFYVKSLNYYEKSLEKLSDKEKFSQAKNWEEKGDIYQEIFYTKDALTALQKSVELYFEVKENKSAISNLEKMRKIYLEQGKLEKARKIETQIVRVGHASIRQKT